MKNFVVRKIINTFSYFHRKYCRFIGNFFLSVHVHAGSVRAGNYVRVIGAPSIQVGVGGGIIIGDRVTLNSVNYGYHLNMHSRVKLMVDGVKRGVIEIGDDTRIHGACIHARSRVLIGKRCLVAANTQIMDCSGHDIAECLPSERIKSTGEVLPVEIGDDVWIGSCVTILPGVRIGRGAVIAAGSVVTKNIPAMVLAGGVPCKVIRHF